MTLTCKVEGCPANRPEQFGVHPSTKSGYRRRCKEHRNEKARREGAGVGSYARTMMNKAEAIPSGAVLSLKIKNGAILVGSDAHIWPGKLTTTQRAFISFAKIMNPAAIVANGDMFDGARISRFPSIGWEKSPRVCEELLAVKQYLGLLEKTGAQLFWPLGNHDMRFETKLAMVAPEYEGVPGLHLKDHFPKWRPCWRLDVNNDTIIKHRYGGGANATATNTIHSGRTMVTGHLHSLQVRPFTDYNGTRYGVDSGTLSEPYSDQSIHYTEANPVNWRSGFVVLTFKNGRLLMPELVQKWDENHVEFRGELVKV